MKKFVFLFFGLSFISLCYTQNIEINSSGLFIDSFEITNETKLSTFEKILGSPERKVILVNTIWTYDKLGILLYIKNSTQEISSIVLDFKKFNYRFSPEKSFSGNLSIDNFYLSLYSPLEGIMSIPFLELKKIITPNTYESETENLRLFFDFSDDYNNLNTFTVSFKKITKVK